MKFFKIEISPRSLKTNSDLEIHTKQFNDVTINKLLIEMLLLLKIFKIYLWLTFNLTYA